MSNEFNFSHRQSESKCYRFEFDEKYRYNVSSLLAELIKTDYLKFYANSIIEVNFSALNKCEKKKIIDGLIEHTNIESLVDSIDEFLQETHHIHLGGYALFRMKNFILKFEDKIDCAIDEYIQKQQYLEFVKFLKFFINMQEPEFGEVNLVVKDGEYDLLNENGERIDKKLLDSTYYEFAALEDSKYIMLNDLISLSPVHITVHCTADETKEEAVCIVKEIFGNRVDFKYE